MYSCTVQYVRLDYFCFSRVIFVIYNSGENWTWLCTFQREPLQEEEIKGKD
jgi:hypothetical protein